MEKRICQKTGLELSVLGLGCWAFGGSDDDYWGAQSQKEVEQIVEEALNLGITYFDTAEAYNNGRSEISLGKVLKGKDRKKVVIGSKILPSNLYKGKIRQHCEASLKRLQTEYMDVYMIHWPINLPSLKSFTKDESVFKNPPILAEAIESLQELRAEGKIRHIGISNFGVTQLKELLSLEPDIAVNQLAYSIFSRAIEEEVLPLCEEKGIGIIGYMPLQQGMLSGRYKNINDLAEIRRRTRHFHHSSTPMSRHGEEGAEDEIHFALQEMSRICQEQGISMPELAIKWCTSNKAITSTIVGTRKVDQLRSSAGAVQKQLSAETLQELDQLTRPILEKLGNNIDYFQGEKDKRGY